MGLQRTQAENEMARNLTPGNTYPDAGANAPAEVQAAIDVFRRLPDGERASTPLLYYLLGGGTPEYKMAPQDAEYVDAGTGLERCRNCRYQYQNSKSGFYICSQISIRIKPEGFCKLWKP